MHEWATEDVLGKDEQPPNTGSMKTRSQQGRPSHFQCPNNERRQEDHERVMAAAELQTSQMDEDKKVLLSEGLW